MTDQEKKMREEQRKKAKALWCVEVICSNGPETRHRIIKNLFGSECKELRETFFAAGVAFQDSPGQWIVLPPWSIQSIKMEVQKGYHDY